MWITTADEDGPILFNLEVRQEIRFVTVRNLDKTFGKAHPKLAGMRFGEPDEMLMVLIGPGLTDFEIIAGFKNDQNQANIAAYVQNAVKQGLQDGTRLLDLDEVLEAAKAAC